MAPDKLPFRRVRKGKGFTFLDGHSKALKDDKLKARLAKLAVPPAWEDVRLARDPNSHIQAVGGMRRGGCSTSITNAGQRPVTR